jgi:phosphoribosyl-ATP pyrophosphohydrolase/phosphoribosyl-AMP cyclohydrolase
MDAAAIDALKFDEHGLIPAVLQDWRDGTVLMIAYMNREALEKTIQTEVAHFWSRSRQSLWEKGATSGNRQRIREIYVDCDQDTLLITVTPEGPACHTGEASCFFHRLSDLTESCEGEEKTSEARGGVLDRIHETILERKRAASSDSYVASLFNAGQEKILEKITEEAHELIVASKGGKRQEIVHEAADLLFHVLVTLGHHDISPKEIHHELARRFGQGGLQEKASR